MYKKTKWSIKLKLLSQAFLYKKSKFDTIFQHVCLAQAKTTQVIATKFWTQLNNTIFSNLQKKLSNRWKNKWARRVLLPKTSFFTRLKFFGHNSETIALIHLIFYTIVEIVITQLYVKFQVDKLNSFSVRKEGASGDLRAYFSRF